MHINEFSAGLMFYAPGGTHWECTDVGQRTVVAVPASPDGRPQSGPPYAEAERVFNEIDIIHCSVDEAARHRQLDLGAEVTPVAVEQPAYELIFQQELTSLVMRHIDRMHDVCEEDSAERILHSFTSQFEPLFQTYLNAKFPGRQALYAAVDAKRKKALQSPKGPRGHFARRRVTRGKSQT